MSLPSTLSGPLSATTRELVSERAFRIALWVGTTFCIMACSLRFGIRFIAFRRLLVEDYLILFSLAVIIAISGLFQRFGGDIYMILHVENGVVKPGPDFPDLMVSGMRADGIFVILSSIGIWAIKINFLLFFRRFGHQFRNYMILWWVAFMLVMGCGAVQISLIPYDCMFGDLTHIVVQCGTEASVGNIYTRYKATVSVDVISDAIIICFPTFIVWRTSINLRQKLVLTCMFLLVGFTIAVTIVRGSIFGGVYKSLNEIDRKVLDMSWLLFWYFIQYVVSFLIACIISFRSLWVNRANRARDEKVELRRQHRFLKAKQDPPSRQRSRWQRLQDSLLDTVNDLESANVEWNSPLLLQHQPPSSRLTIDFSKWGDDNEATSTASPDTSTLHGTSQSSHSRTLPMDPSAALEHMRHIP